MPGALLLSAIQQAIEQTCGMTLEGLNQAKFLHPVVPGQTIELHYQISPNRDRITFACHLDSTVVANGQFWARF